MLMPEKVAEEPRARSRERDPELLTLERVNRLFAELEDDGARSRVLAWLMARYRFEEVGKILPAASNGEGDEPF